MGNYKNFVIPTINVNDDRVTIGAIKKDNLSYVKEGDLLCSFETSKANEEYKAEIPGYLVWHTKAFDTVKVGSLFCTIYEAEEDAKTAIEDKKSTSTKEITVKASKKAIEYAASLGFDINLIQKDGLVKTADIDEYIASHGNEATDKIEAPVKSTGYKSNDVVLVGGGGLALMIIDAINASRYYNILGIVDDYAKKGDFVYGYEVLGNIKDTLSDLYTKGLRLVINCIGGMASNIDDPLFTARQRVAEELRSMGFLLPNVIHPRAILEPTCKLGEGNVILAGANIGSKAIIGDNCYINTNTMISHECVLGNGVRIAPGAILAGRITVGDNTLVGMGSTVYMNVKIGKNVIIYNGVNVFSNVADEKVVTDIKITPPQWSKILINSNFRYISRRVTLLLVNTYAA